MSLAEDVPDKINYRSVGRGDGGFRRLRLPRTRNTSRPSPSTIPAKFETVLYKDNAEKTGFGRQTTRFTDTRSEEQPGPGAYISSDDATCVALDGGVGSVGCRGSNAFATRAPRLERHRTAGAPGPGAYSARSSLQERGGAGPAFILPGSVNPANLNPKPTPGPADYADNAHAVSARGARHTVSARIPRAGINVEGRMQDQLPADASKQPGPGHYATGAGTARASSMPPRGWTIGPSKRWLVTSAAPEKELCDQPVQSLFRAGAKVLDNVAPNAEPGPGDYELRSSMGGPSHISNRGTGAFQKGTSHLPRSWRPSLPGPGEYDPSPVEPAPGAPARASFASADPRFPDRAPGAPGPAYYSPQMPPASKSFHLNLKGGWIGGGCIETVA